MNGGQNPYLKLGELSPNDLLSFAYQIASGMVRAHWKRGKKIVIQIFKKMAALNSVK